MKHLDLVLKKQWFDLIQSGDKLEEYRELKAFWVKRLFTDGLNYKGNDNIDCKYTTVKFRHGYSRDARTMIFEIDHVRIAKPLLYPGAELYDDFCIIIALGNRII